MTKFRKVAGIWVRGVVVVIHTVAAAIFPAKFADAATRDDGGAHRDSVASDEGLRFELDEKASAALAEAEHYVQVAQAQRSTEDVVSDAVQLLNERGVDVGALLQSGNLDDAVQGLVESGDVEGSDTGGDLGDVVDSLDVGDIQNMLTSS